MPRSILMERYARNVLGYSYNQVVTLAVQFVAVPFFLRFWGSARYAEWLILSGIPVTLGLLDFGVAQASASKATMLAARHDVEGVRRCLQTALAFTSLVCAGILTAVLLAGRVIDWASLLKLPYLSSDQAGTVLTLLACHLCANLLGGLLGAWFQAIDKASVGFFLLANRRLLDVLLTVSVLIAGGHATQLAAVLLLGQIAWLLVMVRCVSSWSPWPTLGLSDASAAEWRSVLTPALGYAGVTIGQVVALQGGLQMLNQIAPASVVVIYSMSRTLMRLVLQVGVVAHQALRPELARLIGSGQQVRALAVAKKTAFASLGASLSAYLMLVAVGPWVMHWWGASKVSSDHWSLAAVGAHAMLNAYWYVEATYFFAANQHARLSLVYFVGSWLGIALWFSIQGVVSPIVGASVALAVPEMLCALGIPLFLRGTTNNAYR